MITLALDTSTPHGSVAVVAFGEIAFEETFTSDRTHSSLLFGVLERARGCVSRLDQIVVGLGPGSYAGVRIGIAAAMGMSFSMGSRLIGIPSVAAFDVPVAGYLAIGDARRGAFYLTHIDHGVSQDELRIVSESEVRDQIQYLMIPVFTAEPINVFPSAVIAHPSATRLARLAGEARGIVQTDNLEPLYLRDPHITQPKVQTALPPGMRALDGL